MTALLKKHSGFIIIMLALVTFIAFSPIAFNDFIDYDDIAYITGNDQIKSGITLEGIRWAFSTTHFGYWHPLTWLSIMLDWQIFGANASGHHLVSLLLHIFAALFLFLFLYKTTNSLWASAFAAAFFALHPLRVESVAWTAERKDVLGMFFGMACLYAYAFYAESVRLSRYILCLFLFVFSLMSKPLLVTAPFIMMLLDYWPLRRWQKAMSMPGSTFINTARLVWEKVPLLLFSGLFSIIIYRTTDKEGAMASLAVLPFADRAANAVVSYMAYLGKIFRPVDLAVFYPYVYSLPGTSVVLSCLALIAATIAVVLAGKKIPPLFTGWFWYVGALVPLIGLVQVGEQAMADRHTYLPSIGIAIMLAWGGAHLAQRVRRSRLILWPSAIACLALLAILTWQQCGLWENSETLFSHAIRTTKNNYPSHNNLAFYFNKKGNWELALEHSTEAIRIKPRFALAYYNRGYALTNLGRYQEAINALNESIRLKPDHYESYNTRGVCYYETGQYQKAIADYSEAVRLKSDFAPAYYNRGNALAAKSPDECPRAIEDYSRAILHKPDYADAYHNRGVCYDKAGQTRLALADYSEAIRWQPRSADSYHNRALIYLNEGRLKDGCSDARKACAAGRCKLLNTAQKRGACRN
ncbi:MAG TPA: tetratricopeptide repeat protein [Smithellaceae bacterium]|jgi:tetratricopeptide (TPR) repeat protein|nr:tetratricopeptide repeat protein [Smithellaceae bacterium]HQF83903.1 tetratricopeptide repeat protein [Smithellaceae bacterium]HQG80161.1 tetratricopeptide repeat protein [Smithellaceae bacterium]